MNFKQFFAGATAVTLIVASSLALIALFMHCCGKGDFMPFAALGMVTTLIAGLCILDIMKRVY